MINEARMREEFCELVRIPCHTKQERIVADVLIKKLQELGADSIVEDKAGEAIGGNAGNIIATFNGTLSDKPTVAFSAHMDCVEPCEGIEPILKDGVFSSVGDTILGGDDKVGVVGILEALRSLKERNISHGKIVVIFCIAEEGGLQGSKNIEQKYLKGIDFAYVIDSSTAPGFVVNSAPGQNAINVTMRGVKAHAGLAPEKGLNAIVVMGAALAKLPQGRIDEETTANVGTITGGLATNIVPDMCSIKAEARSINGAKLDEQTKKMVAVFEETAKLYHTTCDIEVVEKYRPYQIEETESVILLAEKAIKKLGLPFGVGPTGGGSDANNFNNYGVTTVVLGTGMTNVHTANETLKEKDLHAVGKIVTTLVEEVADM